jgi:hypothetical protein
MPLKLAKKLFIITPNVYVDNTNHTRSLVIKNHNANLMSKAYKKIKCTNIDMKKQPQTGPNENLAKTLASGLIQVIWRNTPITQMIISGTGHPNFNLDPMQLLAIRQEHKKQELLIEPNNEISSYTQYIELGIGISNSFLLRLQSSLTSTLYAELINLDLSAHDGQYPFWLRDTAEALGYFNNRSLLLINLQISQQSISGHNLFGSIWTEISESISDEIENLAAHYADIDPLKAAQHVAKQSNPKAWGGDLWGKYTDHAEQNQERPRDFDIAKLITTPHQLNPRDASWFTDHYLHGDI